MINNYFTTIFLAEMKKFLSQRSRFFFLIIHKNTFDKII